MRLAAHGIVAVFTGLLLSTASAQAADLGGDCCADLEERVAELEATTARKGNRRMSLTVSGQINRTILYWNDGESAGGHAIRGTGQRQHVLALHFQRLGQDQPQCAGRVRDHDRMEPGGRTSSVDQNSPDGGNVGGFAASDGGLGVRRAFWWLEDKTLGRVSVGRHNAGGPVGVIDLGGVATPASAAPGDVGGGFFFAGTTTRMSAVINPSYGNDRMEGIRYDSPTIGGFVFQAFWGEDDIWTASVRYAGEMGGFRVAAGIGYEEQNSSPTQTVQLDNGARNLDSEWSASLVIDARWNGPVRPGPIRPVGIPQRRRCKVLVGAGRYQQELVWPRQHIVLRRIRRGDRLHQVWPCRCRRCFSSCAQLRQCLIRSQFWGLGVVQQIDAAAMELYLGWRRFDTSVSGILGADAVGNGSSDLDLVHGGARIRF